VIPLPWLLAGSLLLAAGALGTGYRIGYKVAEGEHAADEVKVIEKEVVRYEYVVKEVPKIVTKVVTREVEVEKEVERVVTVIKKSIPPDCVLPPDYGELLVAAAKGIDPAAAPRGPDAVAGAYGCRETLAATLADLEAGWKNTARLSGLQAWARIVTTEPPKD
jgi:hypothetical protein